MMDKEPAALLLLKLPWRVEREDQQKELDATGNVTTLTVICMAIYSGTNRLPTENRWSPPS